MKKGIIYLSTILLLISCNKSTDDGTPPPDPLPTAATLIFPENNKECHEGITVNANQSRVTFSWNASQNTDSYTVSLKNLDTQTSSTYNTTTNQLDITINKGTPYSWYVISRSTEFTSTAQSDTWKFYNAGDAIESHTPFPAEAIAPQSGANFTGITSQTLSWQGSDIDNDIANYDVYFDTVTPPTSMVGNTTSSTMDVTVASNTTYYWRITTFDSEGNSSQSEVFQFRVN